MEYSVIRYRIKEDSREKNRAFVSRVFEGLCQTAPKDLRYLAFELADGEFLHLVATVEGKDASSLTQLAAFRKFSADHAQRQSEPAKRSPARIVGNYRMLTDLPENTGCR
jgi:hypothetical protein